jgi:glycosyltransferase involved in cell wall biosynthesis
MINLMNGCAAEGVEVHCLLETPDNPDAEYLASDVTCHVHRIGDGRRGLAAMRACIERIDPSAVISNRDRTNRLVVRATADLRPRPRTVVRVGTHQPAKLRSRNPLSRWRSRRGLIATYRLADALVGVSDGVCDGLRELLGAEAPPIHRIYSPMDLTRIGAQAREAPTHPWFLDGRRPLLVSVGRLSRIKDQATMLRALALLPADHRLVIFGEGKRRPQLEALAAELGVSGRVNLPGHVENPFSHVAAADLFVLCSTFEGFCNALVEALVAGTPVVSTDCPSGPREILDGGRYGPLVPVKDPAALARAIREALAQPPAPADLAEAVARLEIEQSIPRYLRVLGFARGTAAG